MEVQDEYWVYHLTPGAGPSVVIGSLKLNKFGSGHLTVELGYTIPVGTTGDGRTGIHFGVSNTDTAPTKVNVVLYTWVPASA